MAATLAALLLLLAQVADAQHVVGPGGVTPYGGGAARRGGGYGYVREPAEVREPSPRCAGPGPLCSRRVLAAVFAQGFFVAGSSIESMNGDYKKVETIPSSIPHTFHYAYRKWPFGTEDNAQSKGWHMGCVFI